MNKYEIKLNETEYVDVEYEEYDDGSSIITILVNDELFNIGILKDAYIKTPEGEKKYIRKIKSKEEWKVVSKAIKIWESTHNVPA
jgi:hypothetical protein